MLFVTFVWAIVSIFQFHATKIEIENIQIELFSYDSFAQWNRSKKRGFTLTNPKSWCINRNWQFRSSCLMHRNVYFKSTHFQLFTCLKQQRKGLWIGCQIAKYFLFTLIFGWRMRKTHECNPLSFNHVLYAKQQWKQLCLPSNWNILFLLNWCCIVYAIMSISSAFVYMWNTDISK